MAEIAAVLLAAGASRRFGPDNKLLANLGGKPLICHAAERLAAVVGGPLITVTGYEAEAIAEVLEGLPIVFTHNPEWEAGMGGSIAAGVTALPEAIGGALILPGDMPFVSPSLLKRLLAAFAEEPEKIHFPVTPEGEQRNPVLWPARFFPELKTLHGAEGGKSLLERHRADWRPVPADAQELADIDTEEELSARRTAYSAG